MPYDLRKLNYFFFQEASISCGNNNVVLQLVTCLFCEKSEQLASYKVHPRTGHEGPEGEQMYSSTLPSTSAPDGVGGQRHAPAALPPGKSRYPLYRGLGGPQGRSGRVRKILPPPGFDPRTVQPLASRYTDWAIPAPQASNSSFKSEWSSWITFTHKPTCRYKRKFVPFPQPLGFRGQYNEGVQ